MESLASADSWKTLKSTLDRKYFVYFPPKSPTQTLRFKQEVAGAELHTKGFVTWNPLQRAEEGRGPNQSPASALWSHMACWPCQWDNCVPALVLTFDPSLINVNTDKSFDVMGPRTSRRVSKRKAAFFKLLLNNRIQPTHHVCHGQVKSFTLTVIFIRRAFMLDVEMKMKKDMEKCQHQSCLEAPAQVWIHIR